MNKPKLEKQRPRIVVVGGGAGGLELATRLGRKLGKRRHAEVTLIDCSRTHTWKPLLHEVAAGTLDSRDDDLEYLAQAHTNHFRFVLGRMDGLDRRQRQVHLAAMLNHKSEEVMPPRVHPYDILVIAVGSVCNDFGVPGVGEHCLFLDTTEQAEDFQNRFMETYFHAHAQGGPKGPGEMDVGIVGGGATGIELSAQLHQATRLLSAYGLDKVKPSDIRIHVIEASERLLSGLPKHLSRAIHAQLAKLGIEIHLDQRVIEVTANGFQTHTGRFIPAATKVWAAGVKAPDFLKLIADLETNPIHQIVVRQTLQTHADDDVFGIGDCAACPWPEKNSTVPPRAQSAHQQASLVFQNIRLKLQGKPLLDFRYRDYGSLVALGKYSTVGNLMSNLLGSVRIEGLIARLVYLSLYKMHQLALFGPLRVGLLIIAGFFRRRLRPRIKLH